MHYIELLVAIIIISLTTLLCAPSWKWLLERNQALTYSNDLVVLLNHARTTAINSGKEVIVYALNPKNGSWNNGICARIIKTKKAIGELKPINSGDTLKWDNNNIKHITFKPNGIANGYHGSFYYCPKKHPENALAIIISPSGRTRIADKTWDNKIIPCNSL